VTNAQEAGSEESNPTRRKEEEDRMTFLVKHTLRQRLSTLQVGKRKEGRGWS